MTLEGVGASNVLGKIQLGYLCDQGTTLKTTKGTRGLECQAPSARHMFLAPVFAVATQILVNISSLMNCSRLFVEFVFGQLPVL